MYLYVRVCMCMVCNAWQKAWNWLFYGFISVHINKRQMETKNQQRAETKVSHKSKVKKPCQRWKCIIFVNQTFASRWPLFVITILGFSFEKELKIQLSTVKLKGKRFDLALIWTHRVVQRLVLSHPSKAFGKAKIKSSVAVGKFETKVKYTRALKTPYFFCICLYIIIVTFCWFHQCNTTFLNIHVFSSLFFVCLFLFVFFFFFRVDKNA